MIEGTPEILNAQKILKENGYYVDNLWHIIDVQSKFKCDKDDAFKILDEAIHGEWIVEQINERICTHCNDEKFIKIR